MPQPGKPARGTVAAMDDAPTAAGPLAGWLAGTGPALRGERDADVACATCTACCASSQFVHVAPDEVDALAHIPRELLFPAPRAPHGHLLLGYDERGRCPMLGDAGCTIYEHRPRTCRTYDCRIFPATGVVPDQPLVAARAARWRFDLDAPDDRAAEAALLAASVSVRARPPADAPVNPIQAAVAVVRVALDALDTPGAPTGPGA